MTLVLRVLLIAFSLLTFLYMVRKIRQSKLQIEYAIFWIVFSFILIFMSLFPGVVSFFTWLAGIQAPVNLVFMAIIFILILKLFSMTVKLPNWKTRQRNWLRKSLFNRHWNRKKHLRKIPTRKRIFR